jgi:four helix bundle protein
MQDYRRLAIWQDSVFLAVAIYKLTSTFGKYEIFGLTSQLRRAAVSIACNIAEGTGRRTQADFRHFLHISLGSAKEVENLIMIAKELGYIQMHEYDALILSLNKLERQISSLIGRIKFSIDKHASEPKRYFYH